MSLPELVFRPGIPGQMLGPRSNPDFDGLECAWWGTNKPSSKLRWEKHPDGSGRTVARFQIDYGDISNQQFGDDGQRIEMWKDSDEQNEGDEAWLAWSWFLGDGTHGDLFRLPSSWALMFQHHGIAEGGSPAYALEVTSRGFESVNRVTVGFAEKDRTVIGPATVGHEHYFLQHVRFSFGQSGLMEIWHTLDQPPDPSSSPTHRFQGNTLMSKPSRPTLHMYRDHNQPATEYPFIAYNGGFARAPTPARAQQLAGQTAITPPPPPPPAVDVPGAITDTKATLDWMHRTKKTGGLGYSIAQAKTTHAYAALVKLGGIWP